MMLLYCVVPASPKVASPRIKRDGKDAKKTKSKDKRTRASTGRVSLTLKGNSANSNKGDKHGIGELENKRDDRSEQ